METCTSNMSVIDDAIQPSSVLLDSSTTAMIDLTNIPVTLHQITEIQSVITNDQSLPDLHLESRQGPTALLTSQQEDTHLIQVSTRGEESTELPCAKRLCVETPDGQTYMVLQLETGDDSTELRIHDESELCVDTFSMDDLTATFSTKRKEDINQAWMTSRDEKEAAAQKGQRWKQGLWSKSEVEILQNNINSYCQVHNITDPTEVIFEMSKDERKDFYRVIAKGLQRPLFSVYRRVVRMYDKKNYMGKYSTEETAQIKELKKHYGSDWASIGKVVGRSAQSVKDKSRILHETCNTGKWAHAEEVLLAQVVYELTGNKAGADVTKGISWSAVAERVASRSEKQCRTKWLNHLNWKQKGGAEWTREDDLTLIEKLMKLEVNEETDVDWVRLASDWQSVRSPQWLRGKWWTMKKHVIDYHRKSFQDILTLLKHWQLAVIRSCEELSANKRLRFCLDKDSRAIYSLNGDILDQLTDAVLIENYREGDDCPIDTVSHCDVKTEPMDSARTGAYVFTRNSSRTGHRVATPDRVESGTLGGAVDVVTSTKNEGSQITGGHSLQIKPECILYSQSANHYLLSKASEIIDQSATSNLVLANQSVASNLVLSAQTASSNIVLTDQSASDLVLATPPEILIQSEKQREDGQLLANQEELLALLANTEEGNVVIEAITGTNTYIIRPLPKDSSTCDDNNAIFVEMAPPSLDGRDGIKIGQPESSSRTSHQSQTLSLDQSQGLSMTQAQAMTLDQSHGLSLHQSNVASRVESPFHSRGLSDVDDVDKSDLVRMSCGVLDEITSATYGQTTKLHVLSSHSDPMLPSHDTTDLMTSSSDVEGEKPTNHDEEAVS